MKVSVLLVALLAVSSLGLALARSHSHSHRFGRLPLEAAQRLTGANEAERDALARYVNSAKTTWKAGPNRRFEGMPLSAIKQQLGVLNENLPAWEQLPVHIHTGFDMAALPESFDSREQWPNCPSIREIRDQSDCGSCWAFATVEAATDRLCIGTNGAIKDHLSTEDMLSCCSSCGFGCNGGYPSSAWKWLTTTGVVTGGNFGDNSWCQMYSMPQCAHHTNKTTYPPCGQHEYPTPTCSNSCDSNSTYAVPYTKDKHVFKRSYSISSDPTQIMQEIMTNGPITVAFSVYADFMQYQSGVYQHVAGSYLGGHAVKMIGWGVDNGTPYWLIANSWNEDWAEDGYFRILRGRNECGIEGQCVAGVYQ